MFPSGGDQLPERAARRKGASGWDAARLATWQHSGLQKVSVFLFVFIFIHISIVFYPLRVSVSLLRLTVRPISDLY